MSQFRYPGPMISSPTAVPTRFVDSEGGAMHSVRNARVGDRSPRERFGSQMMSTRESAPAPAPPVKSLTPEIEYVSGSVAPLSADVPPEICQLSKMPRTTAVSHFLLSPGTSYA